MESTVVIIIVMILLIIGFVCWVVAADQKQKKNNRQKNERKSENSNFTLPHGQKRKDGRINFYGNTNKFNDSKVTYNNSQAKSLYSDYGGFKGAMAEKKTANVLYKLSFDDFSHIMNNVRLPLYDKTCEIDHLVIGKFGVIVVETKSQSGCIHGGTDEKNLIQEIGQYTYNFYNPLYQNKTHTDNVKYHLRKGGFKNVPVHGIVVFTSNDVEFPDELGIRLEELPYYYRNLRDVGCDKEKVAEYFQKICVDCSSVL